jgi:hypothetical protein
MATSKSQKRCLKPFACELLSSTSCSSFVVNDRPHNRIVVIQPLSNDFDLRGILACFGYPHCLDDMISVVVECIDLFMEDSVEVLVDLEFRESIGLDPVVECDISDENEEVIEDFSKLCSDVRGQG